MQHLPFVLMFVLLVVGCGPTEEEIYAARIEQARIAALSTDTPNCYAGGSFEACMEDQRRLDVKRRNERLAAEKDSIKSLPIHQLLYRQWDTSLSDSVRETLLQRHIEMGTHEFLKELESNKNYKNNIVKIFFRDSNITVIVVPLERIRHPGRNWEVMTSEVSSRLLDKGVISGGKVIRKSFSYAKGNVKISKWNPDDAVNLNENIRHIIVHFHRDKRRGRTQWVARAFNSRTSVNILCWNSKDVPQTSTTWCGNNFSGSSTPSGPYTDGYHTIREMDQIPELKIVN